MKTKSTAFILFLFIVIAAQAQPEKGTWQIGGSGYWIKTYSKGEKIRNIFDFAPNAKYFVIKNLAFGAELNFSGYRSLTDDNNAREYNLFFSPLIEGYIINTEKWGLSAEGLISFNIYTPQNHHKLFSYFMIGPKLSYNITSKFAMFTWLAYRRLPDEFTNNFLGSGATFPSDNFDIRWGFSYFLHRKKQ